MSRSAEKPHAIVLPTKEPASGHPAVRPHHALALGDLRIGTLRALPDLLREAGLDPLDVLARAGLAPSAFAGGDAVIPFRDAAAALELAARATACPHLGLRLGERFDSAALGSNLRLLLESETVGDALAALIAHHHRIDNAGVPMLLPVARGRAILAYSVYVPGVPGLALIGDCVAAIALCLLRMLCGPTWQPLKVCLPRRQPVDVAPYRHALGQNVSFNSEVLAIVFAADWLRQPVAGREPPAASHAPRPATAEADPALALAARVRRALNPMVLTGTATQAHVARRFALHPRSLSRRLRSEGTRFQDLLNDARAEIARQLLRDTDLRLNEIAVALHYSDASAFTKAFQAQCGLAPRDWRRRELARQALEATIREPALRTVAAMPGAHPRAQPRTPLRRIA